MSSDISVSHLRFADFSVNLGSVPSKFDVSADILLLSNSVIPSHSFKLEHEIISKADKENAVTDQARKLKAAEAANEAAKVAEAKKVVDAKVAETKPAEAQVAESKVSVAQDESPLLDLDFDMALDDKKPAPVVMEATPQPPPVQSHDAAVAIMVEQTKQDKDVCFFYLECADWNLENAIELLKSMQAISN